MGSIPAGVSAQTPSPPAALPASAICELMFEQAIAPSASPAAGADAAVPPDEPAVPLIVADPTILDAAIRACASLAEWDVIADTHADVFGEVDPREFLEARCLDRETGLDAYATCASLAIVRAAETPVPVPTPVPSASPGVGPTTPVEPLVKVPAGLRGRVPGADRVRYFAIGGEDPLELIEEASRRSEKYCPRDAAACTRHQPMIRLATQSDAQTGACRITGIQASFRSDVFLPRWDSPARVEKDLRAWWQRMFRRIVTHEAQHIKIANAHLGALRRQAVGRPCASFQSLFARWSNKLNGAQQAFDRRDAKRPLPGFRGEPVLLAF